MGTQLARAAIAVPKLTHPQRVVLLAMCITARDADRPPVYFGGWDYLALAMGRDVFDGAAVQAVKRTLAPLVTRGLIEPDGWDFATHQRRYLLRLGPGFGAHPQPRPGPVKTVDNLQNGGGHARGVRWS